MAAKIKKGDKVIVLSGKDQGKVGDVILVLPQKGRALVRGVNLVKRHVKQTQNQAGGILSRESSIDLSNLAISDPRDGRPSRVGFRFIEGRKVRFAKRSGEVIDV